VMMTRMIVMTVIVHAVRVATAGADR